MNDGTRLEQDLAYLQGLVDVYGGDETRWPLAQRARFASFVAEVPEARAMVAEARALDAMIGQASRSDTASAKAIAARAVRSVQAHSARTDAIAPERHANVVRWPRPSLRIEAWAAAAVMVAALAFGLFAGQSGWIDPALETLAVLEPQSPASDALFGDNAPYFDEDVI